jgi:hypothetical protein
MTRRGPSGQSPRGTSLRSWTARTKVTVVEVTLEPGRAGEPHRHQAR